MDFNINTSGKVTSMTPELGNWLWHIAIAYAPYDTGNLRRAITMNKNSSTRKQYIYNALNAIYLHYLEKGMGPVKKHKGFISNLTVGNMIQELIAYFKTGKTGILTFPPSATLTVSKQGPMFYERKMINALGWSKTQLTADDRKKLSQMRYHSLVTSKQARAVGKQQGSRYLYSRSLNQRANQSIIQP